MSNRVAPPPVGLVEIDRSNSFTGALMAAWLPGRNYDTTRRQTPTLALGSSMLVAAGIGTGLAWRGVQSASSYVDTGVTASTLGISGSNTRSILAIFRPNVGSGVGGAVWGIGVGGTSNADFSLRQREDGGTDAWRLQIWANDVDFILPGTAGVMRAVLVTYDGATVRIYDGAQAGAQVASKAVTLATPNVRFLVGKWDYNGSDSYGFNGDVAGVQVYNTVYSPQDAARLLSNPWQVYRTVQRRRQFAQDAVTNTNVAPTAGTAQFNGYAPTVTRGVTTSVSPTAGTVQMSGYAPTVTQGVNTSVVPDAGAMQFAGYAPTIAQTNARTVAPTSGMFQLAGYAPSVVMSANQTLTPATTAMAFTGYAPTVRQFKASASPQVYAATIMRATTINLTVALTSVLNLTSNLL